MARRGENIYKRKDGRWEGRYIKGKKNDGRILYGSVYGYKYSDVRAKLLPLKSFYAAKRCAVTGECVPLADWLRVWLAELHVKPSTYATYRGRIERHILPAFGEIRINKIERESVESFKNDLECREFSTATVKGIIRILECALQKAVDARLLIENPCRGLKFKNTKQYRSPVLSRDAQQKLEQVAFADRYGLPIILALYTGMRIGEICALRWEDVNLQEGFLTVRRTLQRLQVYGKKGRTHLHFGSPKSVGSMRKIPLPEDIVELLKSHKRMCGDTRYVLSCRGNKPVEPRLVSHHFHRILREAGLPQINFHSLRHTFATRCMELGVDVTTLSRMLGHSSAKMTLDIYTDSLLDQQQLAMSKLNLLLREKSSAKENSNEPFGLILNMLDNLLDRTSVLVG